MQDYLKAFDPKKFIDFNQMRTNYQCRSCIHLFSTDVLAYLQSKHFLKVEFGRIIPTPLGKAAFASSIAPEDSLQIFEDLNFVKAVIGLVIESDLHLLYLVTPHFRNLQEPRWDAYSKVFQKLPSCEQEVAKKYELTRDYIEWARDIRPKLPDFITDQSKLKDGDEPQELYCMAERLTDDNKLLIKHCKFFMALIANEVLKETPMKDIADMFGVQRSVVQNIQTQIVNYSGMMGAFCERLCWNDFTVLFMRINEKITFQVKEDLLDLMTLPSMRPERARQLFDNNIKTVEELA